MHLAATFTTDDTANKYTLPLPQSIPNEETPLITFQEANSEIFKLSETKAPGFDLISTEVLQIIPHKLVVEITLLFNACIRIKYSPAYWKVAGVIMIAKPGKPSHNVSLYRPISLLPMLSNLLEKL